MVTTLEGLRIELRVENDGSPIAVKAYVRLHAWHQSFRIFVWLEHFPVDEIGIDMPICEFMFVEVENELLKELPESIPDEISKSPASASLEGQAMLVNELANVQQKAINPIIAMKLHTPEVLAAKFDGLDRREPPEQVINVGVRRFVEVVGIPQTHQRGLKNPIRQGVVFQFVPHAGSPSVTQKISTKCLRDEYLAVHTRDFVLSRKIAAVEAAPAQAARAGYENLGEKVEKVCGTDDVHIGQSLLFLEHVPGIAEQVVNVGNGNFHRSTPVREVC